MADRGERDLERRAAAGDAEAEAELLARRLRRGELGEERLSLAADLGHLPACLALDRQPPPDFHAWLEQLYARWGRWVAVRVALALARLQLPLIEPTGAGSPGGEERPVPERLVPEPLVLVAPRLEEDGAEPVRRVELAPGRRIRVGRAEGADLRLSEAWVSSQHCELWLDEQGVVWLEDLVSSNGTWLGERRLSDAAVPVAPGQCIFVARIPLLLERTGSEDRGLAARQAHCLIALRGWLASPSELGARAVHDAAARLVADGVEPRRDDRRVLAGRLALRAAIDAALSAPLTPGTYLPRSRDEPDAWRRAVAGTLGPALLAEPLLPVPRGYEPPAELASLPAQADLRWLGEPLGVEVLGLIARGQRKRTLVARDELGALRILTWFHERRPHTPDEEAAGRAFDATVARAGEALRQPNLARALGHATLPDRGRVFLAELVQGQRLRTWRAERPRALGACVALVGALAGSLDAAVRADLAPVDLTPDDVLIEQPDEQPVLIGLLEGLWLEVEEEARHRAGWVSQRPQREELERMACWPPERLTGAAPRTPRQVVFQLGTLLYWVLAGRYPFTDLTAQELSARCLANSVWAEPPAPRGLPEGLGAVLRRALAHDPAARQASPRALADELAPFLSDLRALEELDPRALEERAARGDAAAESAVLSSRVARGVLAAERLAFAADLGYAPARAARGEEPDPPELDLAQWLARVARWGRRARVAVAVELARLHLPGLSRSGGDALWLQVVATRTPGDACVARAIERGGSLLVGRGAHVDLQLEDRCVSRLHCELICSPDGALDLRDLNSSTGTVCDGEVVGPQPVRVEEGALIRVGRTYLKLQRTLPQPAQALEPVCLECLRVGERWLQRPSEEVARDAHRLRLSVPAGGSSETLTARLAALAVLRAVLGDPDHESPYLPPTPADEARWRACVAGVLGPRVLQGGAAPLRPDEDVPASLRWRSEAAELRELEARDPEHERVVQLRDRWAGLARFGALLARLETDPPRYLVLAPGGGQLVVTQLPPDDAVDPAGLAAWWTERAAGLPERVALARPVGWLRAATCVLGAREHTEGEPLAAGWRATPAQSARLVGALARGLDPLVAAGLLPVEVTPQRVWVGPRGPVLVEHQEALWEWWRREQGSQRVRRPGDAARERELLDWLAPERFEDVSKVGPPTTVWELGALLYWLLAGAAPWPHGGRSLREVLLERVSGRPPRPLRELAPEVPPGLEAIVLRALALAPEERLPRPIALAQALASWLATPEGAGGAG
ncbi:MAG: FHA domain-containing protein [Planctomycetota bacterium]